MGPNIYVAQSQVTPQNSHQAQMLAMTYVPCQQLGSLYEPEQALTNGVLFPELNKPFLGHRGCMR